jgi:hypothetical protein
MLVGESCKEKKEAIEVQLKNVIKRYLALIWYVIRYSYYVSKQNKNYFSKRLINADQGRNGVYSC